jgi:hypothetical protein
MAMTNKNASWLLWIIPLVFIFVAIAFATKMYPIYANTPFYGQDPAYQYLFAGVDILLGNVPAHNDHPGTPLQSLIALTIAVFWSVRNLFGVAKQDMFVSVLAAPELYLMSVSAVVVVLNSLAIYFLGKQIFKVTQKYTAAAVCQMAPLIFALVSPNILYPTPESLLWCISLSLIAVLAPALLGDTSETNVVNRKMAVIAGFFCGVGLAVKVTFLPLVGLLLILRSWRLIALSSLALVVAWFVGVSPIFSRLGKMFGWLHKVINHTGMHGEGQIGIFDVKQFAGNFAYVRNMFPLLDIAIWLLVLTSLFGLVKFVLINRREAEHKETNDLSGVQKTNKYAWATAFVISLVIVSQAIMVAKHPGPTYMIPALPLTGIIVVWFVHTQKFIPLATLVQKVLGVLVFAFFTYQSVTSSVGAYKNIAANHSRGAQANQRVLDAMKQFENPILIGTFNCTLPECALWFGQLMTPEVGFKMDQVTTHFYHFDIFARNLHVPGKGGLSHADTAQVINGFVEASRPVLLISPPYQQLASFEVEKIVSTPVQDLYRVIGFKATQ